ncbi:hypothetical protein HPB52_009111 [Rhipicephalus sanguineus]|uniref:Fatty acyl-CoA reductase C-terminal domain-containing protein n=1 Tax=Rhipicephalus sanguineus TaxID=34632 RepID=A0A9D4T3H9_RHISA|nr:hypothetical protein HPB52_009111 [Rhipicephalus sanguineus]
MSTNEARSQEITSPAAETQCNAESEIARFYKDRAVLITGGTGFIGKILQRLKRDVPGAPSKVTVIPGDLVHPDLGLSKADMAAIIQEVSVVFHLAATVRFNDPISIVDQYHKVVRGMDAVSFYTTNSWLFTSDNVVALMNDLSPTDKQKLDWCQYWDNYMLGIGRYLFKVDDPALPQERENV